MLHVRRRQGLYKLPWDMTTARHPQYNPFHVFGKFTDFVREVRLLSASPCTHALAHEVAIPAPEM